jgi:phosphoserine phosphatase
MPLSGEAIRLMNYIDDVAVTLRRVLATVPTLSAEERARVAEHLQKASPSADDVVQALKAAPGIEEPIPVTAVEIPLPVIPAPLD